MKSFISQFLFYIRFLFIPSMCASCKCFLFSYAVLCDSCLHRIVRIVSASLVINSSTSMRVFAIADYKDPLRRLILSKNVSDSTTYHQLGLLLWHMTPLQHIDYDVVVPIPLHWTRYAQRGFNQAEVLSHVLAGKKGIHVECMLKRVRRTKFQSQLGPLQRQTNVKDAFVLADVPKDYYKDKHILLVDDLMTTGSTLKAAAKVLMQLKPRKITAAVICRVI